MAKHLGRLVPNEIVWEYEKKVLSYALLDTPVPLWRRFLRWWRRI